VAVAGWIAAASGIAAAVGLLFTGYQVWLLNRQARHERRVVLDGVAVSWRPVHAPSQIENDDRTSKWLYELVLVNPGRLPIDDVHVAWHFPCHVVRLRHDGIVDAPVDTLAMHAPVVVGGGERTWRRHLLIDFSCKNDLSRAYADVTFNDIDGRRRTIAGTGGTDGMPPICPVRRAQASTRARRKARGRKCMPIDTSAAHWFIGVGVPTARGLSGLFRKHDGSVEMSASSSQVRNGTGSRRAASARLM
jgi:hypothetical protein